MHSQCDFCGWAGHIQELEREANSVIVLSVSDSDMVCWLTATNGDPVSHYLCRSCLCQDYRVKGILYICLLHRWPANFTDKHAFVLQCCVQETSQQDRELLGKINTFSAYRKLHVCTCTLCARYNNFISHPMKWVFLMSHIECEDLWHERLVVVLVPARSWCKSQCKHPSSKSQLIDTWASAQLWNVQQKVFYARLQLIDSHRVRHGLVEYHNWADY